jgi:hypothetical protein
MKMDLKQVVHDCNGRHIVNLIKKHNLGAPKKYITFIPEEKIHLSEYQMLLAARKPVEGEEYYYYDGPFDEKNRFFCHEVLTIDKVFALSEIEFLSKELGYDVLKYQGSFGCRHSWFRFRGKVIFTPPPTKNQMRVLTVNGSPFKSPWKSDGTYKNY